MDNVKEKYGRYVEYWGQGSDSGRLYWVLTKNAYTELSGKELENIILDLRKSFGIKAMYGGESVTTIVDRAHNLENRIDKLEKRKKEI